MKKILLLIVLSTIFFSCKCFERIVEVEKEVVKTEYRNQTLRDSIYFADTVYIDRQGDTIRITETKYRYKDKTVRDTLRQMDSVYVEKPVCVPADLNGWQKFRLKYFKWLALSIVVLLAYTFRKPLLFFFKNLFS